MKCKFCKKAIETPLFGLKGFCSYECKKAYRMAYKASWQRKKRVVDTKGGYIGINSQNVDTANPHEKPTYKGEKSSLRPLEGKFSDFGGKEYYKLAQKHCCNFEIREQEGYCITLSEPITRFKVKCSECNLMQGFLLSKSEG